LTSTSHRDILRSTTIIGGSQVLNVLLSIIRTKVLAILLGPGGFGLMGMYQSIAGMVGSVTNLGIGSSGVRQIAEAAGSSDTARIARTVTTLRRVSLLTGLAGAALLTVLAFPVSRLTFGNSGHGVDLILVSLTLLFASVAAGQAALIQGLRRIGDLARLSVLGGLSGTVFAIPFVYLWGRAGIAPSMLAVSVTGLAASWWYARRIRADTSSLRWMEILGEAKPLVRLGLVFMASGLMMTGTQYALRLLITRKLGLNALGLFQASATLSNLYVGVILGAMGADFYPRLTAAAQDTEAYPRLVNEQAEVGLLMAAPGILATMVLAPLVIKIFYSGQFDGASAILEWQVLGLLLRVVCWPVGFVLLAKGDGRAFFWTELVFNAL
jgi:enterobacterial common antigen flippase